MTLRITDRYNGLCDGCPQPGTVREGKRSIWQLAQFQIYDGGPDNDADTPSGNTLFAVQGLFTP